MVMFLVLLLEAALQLAGSLVQASMSRNLESPDPGAPLTVLCVGDSNTYGLHLPQIYAYPALLARALDGHFDRPVTVVNRGVPGQGSFQVAAALPSDLGAIEPDLVLMLAGINDAWNQDGREHGLAAWLGKLRLVRLARVMLTGVTSARTFEIATDERGEIVVDRGQGSRPVNAREGAVGTLEGESLAAAVREGLSLGLRSCRDAGAKPVLLTYAETSGPFATVNQAIRELASREDVLLVDVAQAFERHVAEQGYDALMFADHHPNLRGYRLVVDEIMAGLKGAGLLPPLQLRAPVADTPLARPDRPARLTLAADGRLVLNGPPGWDWVLLVSCEPAPDQGFEAGGMHVPLALDQVLARSRLEPGFSGRFDDTGERRVSIPPVLGQGAPCTLRACLLLLRDEERAAAEQLATGSAELSAVAAVSEPLTLP